MRGIFGVCEDTGSHRLLYQKASRNLVASCCISGGVRDAELYCLNADNKSGSWSMSGRRFSSREYSRLDVAIWGRILFHDSCVSLDGLRTFSCKHLLIWIVDLLCAIFPSSQMFPQGDKVWTRTVILFADVLKAVLFFLFNTTPHFGENRWLHWCSANCWFKGHRQQWKERSSYFTMNIKVIQKQIIHSVKLRAWL